MKKIADIIRYIEENLDAEITVESVASVCGYSRFHFQRLFAHCVGVNVGYYINQRRLMKAAVALSSTDMRIIDISCMVRFESQEAFTRAFKKIFKKTPGQYRKEKLFPILKSFPEFDKNLVHYLNKHKELFQPRFVDSGPKSFIGFSAHAGRVEPDRVIGTLWKTMERKSDYIFNKRGGDGMSHTLYGVLRSGTLYDEKPYHYEKFLYSASIEVDPGTPPPAGADYFEIDHQHYAVFEHRGGMENLPLTNKYIWGVWMAQNKIEASLSPDLEVYPRTFKPKVDEVMELWVPIVKRPDEGSDKKGTKYQKK